MIYLDTGALPFNRLIWIQFDDFIFDQLRNLDFACVWDGQTIPRTIWNGGERSRMDQDDGRTVLLWLQFCSRILTVEIVNSNEKI